MFDTTLDLSTLVDYLIMGDVPTLTLKKKPGNMHCHVRMGALLKLVMKFTTFQFGVATIMPNLKEPVTTRSRAAVYHREIMEVVGDAQFTPIMTIYLTDHTTPQDIVDAANAGIVAAKVYFANSTTNSGHGVTNIWKLRPVLAQMQELNMILLIHGEITDPNALIIDREAIFLKRTLKPLIEEFPRLRMVLEHITTAAAVKFVERAPDTVAATITPHHLYLTLNDIFKGGLQADNFCLPIAKRERDRLALIRAATSGNPKFFLGTDSAPHEHENKYKPCGCAGIFCEPVALQAYVMVFEAENKLDQLGNFLFGGYRFYDLPLVEGVVTLTKRPVRVPKAYGKVTPMFAGNTIPWRLEGVDWFEKPELSA